MRKYRVNRLDFVVERTVKTVDITLVDQIKITEHSNVNERQITSFGSCCKDCSFYQLGNVDEICEMRLSNMIGQERVIDYHEYDLMIRNSRIESMEGFIITIQYGTKEHISKEVIIKTYYTITSKKSRSKVFDIEISNNETTYQNSFCKYKDMAKVVNKYLRKDKYEVYINGMKATNLFLNEEDRSYKYCDCYMNTSINDNGIFVVEYTENVFELIEKAAA